MKSKSILFLLLFCSLGAFAQSDTKNANKSGIESLIYTLFDGMREGDSSKVHSVFIDDVRMMSSFTNASGEEVLRSGSLQDFLYAVGTPHDQIWDEQIANLRIQIDDNLAHAWMDYKFFLGDKLSHCGVNAMQLVKIDEVWKIINLIDTRRKQDCLD